MEKKIRSLYEKDIYCTAVEEQEKLPFPTHTVENDVFADEEVYDIPANRIEEALKKSWIFTDIPSINDERLDIHEDSVFKLKDIQIIRYNNRNIICSPYYFKSGGTILDFINVKDRGVHVIFLRK